jgi:endonuclease YncB( thermonuclease family)
MSLAACCALGVGCGGDPLEQLPPLPEQEWCAPDRPAVVACVLDGDTFTLESCSESGEDVRMLGVAAPEIAHNSTETAECYGDEARQMLERLATGSTVTLRFDVECTDMYGRTLAWVVARGNRSDPLGQLLEELDGLGMDEEGDYEVTLNEVMVRAGYATIYDVSGVATNIRYGSAMEEAEEQAQAEGRGLWSACGGS